MSLVWERGGVVLVRLDPTEGGEIRKTRPAVVISHDAACRFDAVVQVVPVTALPDRPLRPYEAALGLEESGLIASDSVRHLRRLSISWGGRVKRDESRTLVEIVEVDNGNNT